MGLGIEITIDGMPQMDLAQALQVEVHEQMGRPTTYRLEYNIDIQDGDLPLLRDPRLRPGAIVSISALLENQHECLVKGPIHGHQISLVDGGAGSQLTVIGSDTSIMMDRQTKMRQWENATVSDIITQIVNGYGYKADIASTQERYLTNKHSLIQQGSDFRFIQRMAKRHGFLFWVRSDEKGMETAHFQPPSLDAAPSIALTINQEQSILEQFDITWDVERPTEVIGQQLDLNTLTTMDGHIPTSPFKTLGDLSLAQIAGTPRSMHLAVPTDDTGGLQTRGKSLLAEAGWFLKAKCSVGLHQTQKPIRGHSIVDIHGAGSRYSGPYFVAGVRHLIDATAHTMELNLLRNGWLK